TPAQNFHGDNIPLSFTVSDGNGGTATAVALLDVLPNNVPVVPDQNLGSLDEDTDLLFTSAQLLRDAFDQDGDDLFVNSVTVDAAHGTITAVSADEWRFSPTENHYGEVFLNFTVSDGKGGMTEAVARVEYLPVNDAPRAGSFSLATNEDQPLTITRDMILSHCSDVDGDVLSLKGLSLRTSDAGKLSLIRPIDGESFWLFEPAANSETPAVLRYTVTDAHGATSAGRINIAVNAVADPLNATGTLQGYVDGLHRLDLDFSAHFPEHDGSEVYSLLSLSGLNALPHGAQLVSGGEVVWSRGDGDTLYLTQEQSMGLTDIFVGSPEAASFDIAVRTQTVERSNGHTAYGMATVHVDIVDR
ncbi:MAG: cadherin-like domain-containing protein, partial [Coriobacteriia bacterium]|nr:cadherin-like domain-containing protein [Coriobacteriia bacterium]